MRTCKLMGIKCDALHSGRPQSERFHVLNEFKHRRLTALFCTDVANRYNLVYYLLLSYSGLDIPSISYVINYDLPSVTKNYVHRVGRTARAGQAGTSISLVSQYDVKRIKAIEKDIGVEMHLYKQVSEDDAEQHMYDVAEKRCKAKIDMLDSGFVERYATVQENRKQSRSIQEQAKVGYEQTHLQQLKNNQTKQQPSIPQQQQDEQIVTKKQSTVTVGDVTLLNKKRKRPDNAQQSQNKKQKIKHASSV